MTLKTATGASCSLRRTETGKQRREHLPLVALHGDSADMAELLTSGGLRIVPGQDGKLREYLLMSQAGSAGAFLGVGGQGSSPLLVQA